MTNQRREMSGRWCGTEQKIPVSENKTQKNSLKSLLFVLKENTCFNAPTEAIFVKLSCRFHTRMSEIFCEPGQHGGVLLVRMTKRGLEICNGYWK